MRKKFVKSDRPTYKRRIKKAQEGIKFAKYTAVETPQVDYSINNIDNPFSEYNIPVVYNTEKALVVPETKEIESNEVVNKTVAEPVVNKPVTTSSMTAPTNIKAYKGLAAFNKAYDEVVASNPEAAKYRQFLTKMAEQESGFNSSIQNRAGAPAYGYFQFMQDDKKYNNIRQYAGTDVTTFRNNPKLQIEAAIKLAKSFEKGFSKEDLAAAKQRGYSTWGLLGGAWLAGNGGIRRFLQGKGNPSDRHWSKEGHGTDVASRIKMFNFKDGGVIAYQDGGVAKRDATYVSPTYHSSPYKDVNYKPTSEIGLVPPKWTIQDGKLVKIGHQTESRVIPLETVSPEFDVLTGIRGISSMLKSPAKNTKPTVHTPRQSTLSYSERIGIPKGERNQPFKSKLDWNNWSKGGPISKEHLIEYNQIEKEARINGSWMRTEDGNSFNGDARTWVQLMSKNGSRFKNGKLPSNNDIYYTGVDGTDVMKDTYNGRLWGSSSGKTARSYTNSDDRVLTIGVPNNSKTLDIDAKGGYWTDVLNPYTGKQGTTDDIVNSIFNQGNDIARVRNVVDNGPNVFFNSPKYKDYDPMNMATDIVINDKVPRKALVGNNGDFNINNPNIYKVLAPFLVGGMNYEHDK